MNTRLTPMDRRAADAGPLPRRYAGVRARTLELAAPLSEEDCCVQSMPDASPVKWHLAHTTWFFETFVLEQFEPGFKPFHADFRVLFNSYYNGVGDKHPRPQRGMLSRPSLATVRDYRQDVDRRMRSLFERYGRDTALQALITLGLNHEQQHQELILTDCKHLLSLNPLKPVYRDGEFGVPSSVAVLDRTAFAGGVVAIGAGNGDGDSVLTTNCPAIMNLCSRIHWRRAWSPTANTCSSSKTTAAGILDCGSPKAGSGSGPSPARSSG